MIAQPALDRTAVSTPTLKGSENVAEEESEERKSPVMGKNAMKWYPSDMTWLLHS